MTHPDPVLRPFPLGRRLAAWLPSAALALALLAACGGGGESRETALPPGMSPIAEEARVALPPAVDARCQPASVRKVFHNEVEWSAFWDEGLAADCPRPSLPQGFDFSREMVAYVTMGKREAATDSITILGSGVMGDSVVVLVRRTSLQDGCTAESVDTWPASAARIPADTRPVKFLEERRKLPC